MATSNTQTKNDLLTTRFFFSERLALETGGELLFEFTGPQVMKYKQLEGLLYASRRLNPAGFAERRDADLKLLINDFGLHPNDAEAELERQYQELHTDTQLGATLLVSLDQNFAMRPGEGGVVVEFTDPQVQAACQLEPEWWLNKAINADRYCNMQLPLAVRNPKNPAEIKLEMISQMLRTEVNPNATATVMSRLFKLAMVAANNVDDDGFRPQRLGHRTPTKSMPPRGKRKR